MSDKYLDYPRELWRLNMGETSQVVFSHKEVVEALVKRQGIHDGIWGLYVRFGISAANLGPGANEIVPAAIVPILEIGLQKFEQETNLSVDAAKVNPGSKGERIPSGPSRRKLRKSPK
jgi:hypothetical protein